MNIPKLSQGPISLKLLCTMTMIMIGLTYLTLVVHIYIDTEMKPALIAEAYGFMEYIGLTSQTHKYLPYYTTYIFFIPAVMLVFSSFSEKLKSFFAVWPFLLILLDIASMWLIPYLSTVFAYVLFVAGSLLGLTFLVMFLLILHELWFRKTAAPATAI